MCLAAAANEVNGGLALLMFTDAYAATAENAKVKVAVDEGI
jgi:hypothetical protein